MFLFGHEWWDWANKPDDESIKAEGADEKGEIIPWKAKLCEKQNLKYINSSLQSSQSCSKSKILHLKKSCSPKQLYCMYLWKVNKFYTTIDMHGIYWYIVGL